MKPIIFLDIDGVLNDHKWNEEAQSCTIRTDCMNELNRIIKETSANIVLSSAWRYMVLGGTMSITGFEYLLRTHGFISTGTIIGHTGKDRVTSDRSDRAKLIKAWVIAQSYQSGMYIALDDDDLGYTLEGIPLVLTNGKRGLTEADALNVIQFINHES